MAYNNSKLHTWGPSVPYPRGRPNNGAELDNELDRAYESLNDLHARLLAGITNAPTWSEVDKAPTAAQVAARIAQAISDLLDGAPGALDTLNELAAALGDDANFASTVMTCFAARYLKTEIDAFFEGESGGKKQVDWARIINKPASTTIGRLGIYIEPTSPVGVLYFNGTYPSRASYPELWAWVSARPSLIDDANMAAFGTGDGSTTFRMPDWRGLGVRGAGVSSTYQMANGAYYDGGALMTVLLDAMQGHRHNIGTADNGGSASSPTALLAGGANTFIAGGGNNYVVGSFFVGGPRSDGTNGPPRTSTETRGVSVGIHWGISYE